jgi:hypothetical protein
MEGQFHSFKSLFSKSLDEKRVYGSQGMWNQGVTKISRGPLRAMIYRITTSTGDYGDLARAMIEEASPYIPKLMEKAQAREREADLAEAQRLLRKHGREQLS